MVENEVLRDMAHYEAMSPEELEERYSDLELRFILQRVFNMDSTVYFMPKRAKLEFIADVDARPRVLEAAEVKRSVHRDKNREASGRKSIAEVVAETGDQYFRFLSTEHPADGFEDSITGRRGQVAYVLEDVSSGDRFQVTKGTVRELDAAGRLEGFNKTFASGRKSAAHEAGKTTLADRRSHVVLIDESEPEAAPAVSVDLDDLFEDNAAEAEEPEVEPEGNGEGAAMPEAESAERTEEMDQELDDILNSIPS